MSVLTCLFERTWKKLKNAATQPMAMAVGIAFPRGGSFGIDRIIMTRIILAAQEILSSFKK